MTQICIFNKRLVSTHYTLNYAIHGAFLRMVLLTDVYRNFGEYFLKISVHKNSQRICYKFLKKHSIKVDLNCLHPGNVHLNNLNAPRPQCVNVFSVSTILCKHNNVHDLVSNSILFSYFQLYDNLQTQFFHNAGAMQRPTWWNEIVPKPLSKL